MNKVCCLSLVLAGVAASAAFADYTDQYTNVFTGVTAVSSDGVPSATGGTWAYNGVTLSNVDNKVEFEADGEAVLAFTMNAAPQDTNTIFRVAVNGTIEDVGELSAPAEGAQTAFAICTNAFHAWNGSSWVVLDEVPAGFDGSVPTNLLVEINYQGTNVQQNARKARFTVGNTVLSPRDSAEEWIPLGTPANNLTGFGLNSLSSASSTSRIASLSSFMPLVAASIASASPTMSTSLFSSLRACSCSLYISDISIFMETTSAASTLSV